MKTNNFSNLSRRDFLKIFGATSVVAAGGHMLHTYTPWLDYKEQVSQNKQKFDNNQSDQMIELVRYATLAANGHNTQPWKFSIKDHSIEILPDYNRRLPVVDPNDRELWISLGCALENLLITARAIGFAPELSYPDNKDLITVSLQADPPQVSPLFDAIPERQTTRGEFDGQIIKASEINQLQELPLEPGVSLHFVSDPVGIERVAEYVNQGNLAQYGNPAFIEELIFWLRFNRREILNSLDGLYSVCSGNPEVPAWLGKMFVSGTKPQQQADADAKKLRSSSGVVNIASENDDKSSWVRTGQVYERLTLMMTSLNIKSALLNQPIEVPDIRPQFQSAMNLGERYSQLLVRFGYAPAMPKSIRKPVEQVLV
ncbi:MAG: Tat pathway signal protein [Anaerolineaceae bacterium]|nr:Tat pathway signal protein [Anaerolineaceae bacterium]